MAKTLHVQYSMRRGRCLKWTEAMNIKPLECKRKAIDVVKSNDLPRRSTGRMKSYMALMKELWDKREFAKDLNLSSQNLKDQVARIEKSLGNVWATIREEVNADNNESLFDAVYLERNEGQDLAQEELYEINNNSL